MTDWESIAKNLDKKWKSKIAECEYLDKVLEKTAAELAKVKYSQESLTKELEEKQDV